VVIAGAAHVVVQRQRRGLGGLRVGGGVEAVLEDGGDAAIARRTDAQRPPAGGLETRMAVLAREVQYPETSAVAVLGVWALLELALDEAERRRPDALRPVEEAPR